MTFTRACSYEWERALGAVICPLCHGTKEEASSLEGLSAGNVHCSTCMVDFDTDPPEAFRSPVRGFEGELALSRTRAERAS